MQPLTTTGYCVPRWRVLESHLASPKQFISPPHDAQLSATFFTPSGHPTRRGGFWDGGDDRRVRFAPDEEGHWRYTLLLQDHRGAVIATDAGSFVCTPALDATVFDLHGPVRMADHKRHLIHADGTPFFWLADTAWNGPLRSTAAEWQTSTLRPAPAKTPERRPVGGDAMARRCPKAISKATWLFVAKSKSKSARPFFSGSTTTSRRPLHLGLLNVPVLLWAIRGRRKSQD